VCVQADGLAFRARAERAVSGRGHVVLRYERLRLNASNGATRARGVVRDAIFTGSAIHYVLGVEGSPIELVAEAPYDGSGEMHPRGAMVNIGWDEAAPRLLQDG
jgi:hypothetical protein